MYNIYVQFDLTFYNLAISYVLSCSRIKNLTLIFKLVTKVFA